MLKFKLHHFLSSSSSSAFSSLSLKKVIPPSSYSTTTTSLRQSLSSSWRNFSLLTNHQLNQQQSSPPPSDNNNSSSSPSSNNNNNSSSQQPSQFTFSLEDLEKVKQELIQNLLLTEEQSTLPLPSPGKSSGNESIDEATKQWRLTNTKDDENLQKLFKSTQVNNNRKATTSLLQQSKLNSGDRDDDSDDSFQIGVDEDDYSKYVNPFNPETQEVNGPKGAEPTRFGDWERSGRCVDF